MVHELKEITVLLDEADIKAISRLVEIAKFRTEYLDSKSEAGREQMDKLGVEEEGYAFGLALVLKHSAIIAGVVKR